MNRVKTSCRNCENRAVGCHGKCLDYKDFQQAIEADKKLRMRNKQITAFVGEEVRKTKAYTAKRNKEMYR